MYIQMYNRWWLTRPETACTYMYCMYKDYSKELCNEDPLVLSPLISVLYFDKAKKIKVAPDKKRVPLLSSHLLKGISQ
jgi:hypothetical protein